MKKRAVRLLIAFVAILTVGAFTFRFFDPIFVYNFGWKPLPNGAYPSITTHTPRWTEVGAEADAWLSDVRAAVNAAAVSAAVSVDGERVWAGAAGYADLDSKTEATLATAFRIGSSSKAVTSVAMGVMLEDGVVNLGVPVSTYLPDLSEPLASITTRQAMSHTAGVRDYGLCLCFPIWEYYNRRHYDSQREALRPFEEDDLLFAPGEGFFYSSYGYNVAGAVIEGVSGLRFRDFLKQRVFDRIGMDHSRSATGEPLPQDATFYEVRNGTYKEAYRVNNTNKLPSGGILSTPADMVRLGQQMIAPTLFSEETRNLLIRHQPLADGQPNPQGYALGWRNHELQVLDGAATTRVLHHHGVAYGAVSHFAVYPEYGMVMSIMMNTNLGSFGGESRGLADMFISAINAKARKTSRTIPSPSSSRRSPFSGSPRRPACCRSAGRAGWNRRSRCATSSEVNRVRRPRATCSSGSR